MTIEEVGTMEIRTNVKVGGVPRNHNESMAAVRTGVRAGGMNLGNHNETAVTIRTGVRAGGVDLGNHNESALTVRPGGVSWGHGCSPVHGRGARTR